MRMTGHEGAIVDGQRMIQTVRYRDRPDPWSKAAGVLAYAIVVVVVTALSAVLYFLVIGVLNPPAPRTAYEARTVVVKSALASNPGNGKTWADLILLSTSMKRLPEAEKAWRDARKVLAKLPDQVIKADLAWAQSLMLQDRFEEAIQQADLVIAEEPRALKALAKGNEIAEEAGLLGSGALAPAHAVRGHSFAALGRWDRAVDAYSSVLRIDSYSADILLARGEAYLKLGRKDEARADLAKVLTFMPDQVKAKKLLDEIGVQR